ncbi:MAG: hypothetical protein Q8Q14_09360 [Gemmatimonadales bacterium]|nr:hypothetical protein [Gemmatimonadales bacterium]
MKRRFWSPVTLFVAGYVTTALAVSGAVYVLTEREQLRQREVAVERSVSCVQCHAPTTCSRGRWVSPEASKATTPTRR